MARWGTPFFKLNAESKETKLQKKQWYVYNLNFFLTSLKKLRGPNKGSRRGSRRGVQVLSTPVH